MATRFLLTPTLEHILGGRGMKLICCAPHCMHETGTQFDDPYFERKITTQGYGKCPRCNSQTPIQLFEHIDNISLNKQFRSQKDMIIPVCEKCGNITKVVYTQYVISKHRKSRHCYYHDECYERMHI
jgi:hypothetical protein